MAGLGDRLNFERKGALRMLLAHSAQNWVDGAPPVELESREEEQVWGEGESNIGQVEVSWGQVSIWTDAWA